MIIPRVALVRPRVVSKVTSDVILLEDAVQAALESGRSQVIELHGGCGSGKSTALAHLASQAWGEMLHLLDEPEGDIGASDWPGVTVYSTRISRYLVGASYAMAKWEDVDLAALLQSYSESQRKEVLCRLLKDPERNRIMDSPLLCTRVLDEFCRDDQLASVRVALQRIAYATEQTTQMFTTIGNVVLMLGRRADPLFIPGPVAHFATNTYMQLVVAADLFVEGIRTSWKLPRLGPVWSAVIDETASILATRRELWPALATMTRTLHGNRQPMAASVLHQCDPTWRPAENCRLPNARLRNANWADIPLHKADLSGADLSGGIFTNATFEKCEFHNTNLANSDLRGAHFKTSRLSGIDFSGSRLENAHMGNNCLRNVCFSGAQLHRLESAGSAFIDCDLRNVDLSEANLAGSRFYSSRLDGANLCKANLVYARLRQLDLRNIRCDDARMSLADFSHSILEDVRWVAPNCEHAHFESTLLTGSTIVNGCFSHCDLSNAFLADINWEEVDLRHANMQGCVFHMGSSRSGHVPSPYPSHGTRTGFYTNDYYDKTHKSPEDIRKANLCGADLRGASVIDADFYLVDLRYAQYDSVQAEHFRRCQAILGTN